MLRRRIRIKRKEYRIGKNAKCKFCVEGDVRALDIVNGSPICRACRLTQKGKSTLERHHFSGRRNDRFMLEIPANEHAFLSDYQNDWPEVTMSNPNRDPLLEIAAWMRAVSDYEDHMKHHGKTLAERIEQIAKFLERKLGKNWIDQVDRDGDKEKKK